MGRIEEERYFPIYINGNVAEERGRRKCKSHEKQKNITSCIMLGIEERK